MATANLTAIKDRIAELTIVPKSQDKTVAARTRRAPQRRRQNQNTTPPPSAEAPAVTASRNRYSIAKGVALLTALSLAGVSGLFSVVGLTGVFLGSFWPVVAMGTVFEVAKLSAVALVGQGRVTSRTLKFGIVTLIAALMVLNFIGAYGFLARAQITYAVSGEVRIADHAAQLQTRIRLAAGAVADIDKRIEQIDSAIAEATERGRTASAMALAEHQTVRRDALAADRARAASALASVEIQGAGVESERAVQAADFGPVEYVSKLLGIGRDTAMRWFIVLVACLLDPAALMLLLAACARHPSA